ncbi:50S ribosomal protein L11 methyltransferase [Palleronia abyssalis]|uniref:Ribosomal protein L11 methyltransferase n=1 Tax=Palleronia abyssalis TaxID=1501240 RepID=A0A2R8BR71_9RHOB|nr:50S ribosomal protein L11 methyltransferase [Palleronia abyssalis]SPJ22674.1 Ribosomal protein L11 methyltransferase [Palleronia abyssalis]
MAKDFALSFPEDDEARREFEYQSTQEADRLVQLAKLTPLTDGGLRTLQLLSEALVKVPHHHEARILRDRLYQMFVPRWHFPMLGDKLRNRAYSAAIASKVKPGDVVLDIGCGAGLTAMLAARAGAKHVYTCEQQPLIAQAASRVIEENGLADRITVIPKMSHDLVVGVDLPEPVDVVISEIVDTMLLGEGALATLSHAMRDLAKPDARAIPERGKLMAQVVESDPLMDLWRPRAAEGFDLSAFHHFATVAQITPNDYAACELAPLGPAEELFEFDFTKPDLTPGHAIRHLGCTAAGTIHAVSVYFQMDLAPGIELTNDLTSDGHWGRTAFLLDQPVPVGQGDTLTITAQHDTSQLSLTADELAEWQYDPHHRIVSHVWDNGDLLAMDCDDELQVACKPHGAEAIRDSAKSAELQM